MVSLARPTSRDLLLYAADGVPLAGRVFEPGGRPRATVVIHGATAVPASYYAAFAGHLATRGLRAVIYDYRGIGGSRAGSLRGLEATMTDWAERDARAVHGWARDQGGRLVVIGHSFGGQLIGLVDEVREADAVVLVASQLGYYGHWPAPARWRLAATWRALVPAVTAIAGYLPGRLGLGEDLPAGVAREWARWCLHPDYLVGHRPDAADRFARFDVPTRLYSFTDDWFAPRGAVDALLGRLSGAPVDHRRVAPADVGLPRLGHFAFFRPSAEALWRDAVAFIDAALRGEAPAAAPRPAWITDEEIAADLAFGRS